MHVRVELGERRCQLVDVARYVPRDAQETALEQIAKVKRALLVLVELREQQRMNRPANDTALNQRAAVETDDRGTVKHRIEVVAARVGIEGCGRLFGP